MEQLETKLLKEISDIKFALSLMMKHDTTSVPTDERNKITDIELLRMKEACTRQPLLPITPSSKLIYVSLHYSHHSPKYVML